MRTAPRTVDRPSPRVARATRTDRRRAGVVPNLTGRWRKLVRAAHAVVAAGWLGLTVAMCTLGVSAATTADPVFALAGYRMMERLGNPVIAAFAVATLLTGVLASVTTPWGCSGTAGSWSRSSSQSPSSCPRSP